MTDRTTKTLTTPNGNKVVVYDYINGGELRKFQSTFLQDMTAEELMDQDNASGQLALSKIKASTMLEAQDLLLSLLVVSVDDKTGDGKDLVHALRPKDGNFVTAELTKYTTEGEGKKK